MSGYDMHSFCDGCGQHRLRMPFGSDKRFFDVTHGPYPSCGEPGPGHRHICRPRGLWRRIWIDRDGRRVDLPVAAIAEAWRGKGYE